MNTERSLIIWKHRNDSLNYSPWPKNGKPSETRKNIPKNFACLQIWVGQQIDSCLTGVFWKHWICMTSVITTLWCFIEWHYIANLFLQWNTAPSLILQHLYPMKKHISWDVAIPSTFLEYQERVCNKETSAQRQHLFSENSKAVGPLSFPE